MQYGICTWTYGDQTLAKTASILSELGFDGVELLGDLSLYSAQEAKQILDDHGLSVFSLTPADADISHPDDAVRRKAVDYYYRLIDFASELGNPRVSCHGLVGRIKALSTMEEENAHLIESVKAITARAQQSNLRVVWEVLNRYETHQIHTGEQAVQLVTDVGADNFGVLLDAYHMNIEEPDPAGALRTVGDKLWLYHVADSNRRGVGHGHTDFNVQIETLNEINYDYATILECSAPGENPFTPVKADGWREVLTRYYSESLTWLKQQ